MGKIYISRGTAQNPEYKVLLCIVSEGYSSVKNFLTSKLTHPDDDGNTYASHYTFEEFYRDIDLLGFEVVKVGQKFGSTIGMKDYLQHTGTIE